MLHAKPEPEFQNVKKDSTVAALLPGMKDSWTGSLIMPLPA